MPNNKRKSESSDSDSGPEDRGPAKKQKKTPEEKNSWDLGKNRFVRLHEFNKTWYVDIREFYETNGELKPGRKGIMLTMDQWKTFKGIVGYVEEAINKNV